MKPEDIKLIKKHLPTIKTIVNNRSCSNLTIEFREDMKMLAASNGIKYCSNCSSGIFSVVYRLYNLYNIELENTKKTKKQDTK